MSRWRLGVVVPTRDRPAALRRCLEAVAHHGSSLIDEVIVVDDGSTVAIPPGVAPRGLPVRVIRNGSSRGAAASRNAAVDDLHADAVAFIDDDSLVCPDWFAIARSELHVSRAAITGPVVGHDSGPVARARQLRYDARYRGLGCGAPVDFLAGGNAVVWREAFVRAGGFPDRRSGSDNPLAARLKASGGACHFVPSLVVLHRNSKGLGSAVAEAWRSGRRGAGRSDRRDRLSIAAHGAVRGPDRIAHAVNLVLEGVVTAGYNAPLGADEDEDR